VSFKAVLDKFADYRDKANRQINAATVCVTERYARSVLKIKKDKPLEYRGLSLRCIGSKRWRQEHLS
jgi:hypothetical protein